MQPFSPRIPNNNRTKTQRNVSCWPVAVIREPHFDVRSQALS